MDKTCLVCGKKVHVLPCRTSWKTCSIACRKLLRPKQRLRRCLQCGVEFNATRNDRTLCSNKCRNKYTGEIFRQKKISVFTTRDPNKWKASVTSDKARERTKALHTNRKRTSELSRQNSPNHVKAATFFVKSPRNITYLVMNICKFVSENETLFPAETVVWTWVGKSRRCRATMGLSQINRGIRGSWKGWMRIGNLEGKENIELVPRAYQS